MAPIDSDGSFSVSWDLVKTSITENLINPIYENGEKLTVGDVTLVDAANPADFRTFAKTLLGTLLALLAVGATAIEQAFFDGLAGFPDAIGSFVTDVTVAVLSTPGNLLETASNTTAAAVSEYGVFAFVVGVAVVLIALYVANKAVEVIR